MTRRKIEKRLQRAGGPVHSCRKITQLRVALRHRLQCEIAELAGWHFLPGERSGDPAVGRGSHGIGRSDGSILGILIVVDEDTVTLLLPPLAGDELGSTTLGVSGERQGGAPYVVEAPPRFDPQVDVDAPGAGGLRPSSEAQIGEHFAHEVRRLANTVKAHPGSGIQIHAQFVRVIQIVGPDRVRVEIDAAQIHEPGKLRQIGHDDLVRRPS
jgi:hypothetical protein